MRLLLNLGFRVELLSNRFFFRRQIMHKRCALLERVRLPVYFETDVFRKTVSDAIDLIGQKDQDTCNDIVRHLRAFVEVSPNTHISNPINMGFSTGVYYARLFSLESSDLAVKSIACSIVQFVTSYRLIVKTKLRCPERYGHDLMRKIKRLAIQRMHRFTIVAGFESRYSYEIECRLMNGAYDC